MATSFRPIKRYLALHRREYEFDKENNCIVAGFRGDNVELLVRIALYEEGRFFEITALQVLVGVKDQVYKGVLFQTLLAIAWEYRLVRWEYDPLMGEVHAKVQIPLEDAPLTQMQFEQCLNSLIQVVDLVMPRLQAVLATGEDPGETELGERLLLGLQEFLPDGSLNLLEQALAARKQRGIT